MSITKLEKPLKIGLPKGSLEESTFALFGKAGFNFNRSNNRSYKPYVDDEDLDPRLIRPQEICRYITQGFLDCGITGKDWIAENLSESNAEVHVICDLN
ncbi:MAG: hypothetical protein V4507_03080, partial [Verrucomicrobiota bacterium]